MKSNVKNIIHPVPSSGIAARVDAIDWAQASRDLDAQGCAVFKGLLSAEECRALAFQSNDEHERAAILKLAAEWDRLAAMKAKKEAAAHSE